MLRKAKSITKPIKIITSACTISSMKNVFWNIQLDPMLLELHNWAISCLHPLSEGYLMRHFEKLLTDPNLDPSSRIRIQKYGCLSVKEKYQPHITLCHLEDSINFDFLQDINPPKTQTLIDFLALGKLGEMGNLEKYLFKCRIR